MIVDPRFCTYCGTQTLTPVARGERSPFVGGECSNCQTVTLVDHDDAERAAGRPAPAISSVGTTPPTALVPAIGRRATDGFGLGSVIAVAMHDGNFWALLECDDGRWIQVRAATLRSETPS